MYQAGVEGILGLRLRGSTLSIEPCIPRSWPGYRIDYRRGSTHYGIEVENPHGVSRGVASVELDGLLIGGPEAAIPLVDDGQSHSVKVVMGTIGDAAPQRESGNGERRSSHVVHPDDVTSDPR
jgi:cyclic beta-1,2-glucan synthetase